MRFRASAQDLRLKGGGCKLKVYGEDCCDIDYNATYSGAPMDYYACSVYCGLVTRETAFQVAPYLMIKF